VSWDGNRGWLFLGVLFLVPYLVGTFHPEGFWWGVHALGYLDGAVRVLVLGGVSLLILLAAVRFPSPAGKLRAERLDRRGWLLLLVGMGVLAGTVFWQLEIQTDAYGDEKIIRKTYAEDEPFQVEWLLEILSPRVYETRDALPVNLHRIVAYAFGASIDKAYRWVSVIVGGLFVALWLWFLRRAFGDAGLVLLFLIAGLLAGANQIFFGHIENYPFIYLAWTAFLICGYFLIGGGVHIGWFFLLFLVAFRGHAIAAAFLPGLLFALAHRYSDRLPWLGRVVTWKGIWLILVLPFVCAGILAYFLYFGSYNEPHGGSFGRLFEQSFLPIIPADPPWDRYLLMSGNHIRDFLNVLLLVCIPPLYLVTGMVILERSNVDWRHPRVKFFFLCLLFPLLFFFAFNPILTMIRDWDLYALLTPPMLMFGVVLTHHSRVIKGLKTKLMLTLALGCFSTCFFILNASPERLSYRLVDAGMHTYRTYYAGAGYLIRMGLSLDPEEDRRFKRHVAVLETLEDIVYPGDEQYTQNLCYVGYVLARNKQYDRAMYWLQKALTNTPDSPQPHQILADIYLVRRQPVPARTHLLKLSELDGENPATLRRWVRWGFGTGNRETVEQSLRKLLEIAPTEPETHRLMQSARERGWIQP
jgi:hypothetical protein